MGYRKQLPIRTESIKIMGAYTFKKRVKKLEESYRQSVQYRIKQATTPAEKRAIVAEQNPLFYVFGENRRLFKQYQTYEENYGIK